MDEDGNELPAAQQAEARRRFEEEVAQAARETAKEAATEAGAAALQEKGVGRIQVRALPARLPPGWCADLVGSPVQPRLGESRQACVQVHCAQLAGLPC